MTNNQANVINSQMINEFKATEKDYFDTVVDSQELNTFLYRNYKFPNTVRERLRVKYH